MNTQTPNPQRQTRLLIGVQAALATCTLIAAGVACACTLPPSAYASVTGISVDGKIVYSSSAKDKTASVKGVSFDKKSATLTLSNLKLVPKSKKSRSKGAIFIDAGANDTVTVKLKGTNSIKAGLADCYGIRTQAALDISGTNLSMTGMGTAVKARGVLFGPGTFSFKRCSKEGICATGLLVISGTDGGKLSVTTTEPTESNALALKTGMASNSHKRLGTITGKLAGGVRFQHSGSVYQVIDEDHAKLVSWGGGVQANLANVTFGKNTYQISVIGASAFNTPQGKKVTKITLGPSLRAIGSEAFAGTERLTSLRIGSWLSGLLGSVELTKDALEKRLGLSDVHIDKKAFKGCGQLAGFDLAVHTGIKEQKVNLATKAILTLRGLPALAQVTK